jgi:hypothetical protein
MRLKKLYNGIPAGELRKFLDKKYSGRRTEKHFADVMSDAAGKQFNIFLRIIKVAD